VVPDKEELEGVIKGLKERITGLFGHQLVQSQARLNAVLGSYGLKKPVDLVNQKSQFLDELSRRAQLALENRLGKMKLELKSAADRLATLSPKSVLARGYSIVRRRSDNRVVREYKEVKAGEGVELIFSKGKAEAEVTKTLPEGL
ncbi:MAG: exodeoxyribonuclease VII large subunit, partial [Limisphaerales bacterium]